jgi:hypothetical protein
MVVIRHSALRNCHAVQNWAVDTVAKLHSVLRSRRVSKNSAAEMAETLRSALRSRRGFQDCSSARAYSMKCWAYYLTDGWLPTKMAA